MPLVSVIIPVYNVCNFIDCGIRNVLNQTCQDLEIILSDDGSDDGSYDLCKEWSEKDSRIKLFRQENKGAGSARNHGLENAKGKFIYFFDIDDEIKPNLLEYCVKTMDEKDVDFICFGYNNVETTFNSKVTVTFPEKAIESNQELRDLFVDEFIMKVNGFPWNKVYRKSFLDNYNLKFEDQRIQQDEVFNLKCYKYLEKAYLSSEVMYTYYIFEKGNTRSRFIPERFDIYKSVRQHFEELINYWNLNDNRLDNYLNKRFYNSVIQCFTFNLTHPNCKWTKTQKKEEMRRINSDPLTQQAYFWALKHNNGFEQLLLRHACMKESLFQIQLYTKLFNILHSIRRRFK